MNETDQFLKDTEREDVDAFAHLTQEAPEVEEPKVVEPEEVPDEIKNRRHRRIEAKYQAEREANIALNARLVALAEAKETANSPEYLKRIERIYGTDTPEALAATEILKEVLTSVKEDAESSAFERLRAEKAQEAQALVQEEKVLDTMLENIEEDYGVDLTSEKAETTRKGFLKVLEKMSPKDSDGNIIAYADPDAVWEVFQSASAKKPENPAKVLASRGLVNSGSPDSKLQESADEKWLKEQGII